MATKRYELKLITPMFLAVHPWETRLFKGSSIHMVHMMQSYKADFLDLTIEERVLL